MSSSVDERLWFGRGESHLWWWIVVAWTVLVALLLITELTTLAQEPRALPVVAADALTVSDVGAVSTGLVSQRPPRIERVVNDIIYLVDSVTGKRVMMLPGNWSPQVIDEFHQFLTREHQPLDAPYTLRNLTAQASLEQGLLKVCLRLNILTHTPTPVWVPLGLAEGAILTDIHNTHDTTAIQYQGLGSAELTVAADGAYVIVVHPDTTNAESGTETSSSHQVELTLWFAVTQSGDRDYRCAMSFPSSIASQLTLTVPIERAVVTIPPDSLLTQTDTSVAGQTTVTIQSLKSHFTMAWRPRPSDASQDRPLIVAENGGCVARITPTDTRYEAEISLRSLTTPISDVEIRLPPETTLDPSIRHVLAHYSVRPSPSADPTRGEVILIAFNPPTMGPVSVYLRAIHSQTEGREDLWNETLGGFEVLGAEKQVGTITAIVPRDVNTAWSYGSGIQRIPLPSDQTADTTTTAAKFEYFSLPLTIHATMRKPQSRINVKPEHVVEVSRDRAMLTSRFAFQIHGTKTDRLIVQLGQWNWYDIGPTSLVDIGGVFKDDQQRLHIPLRTPSEGLVELELKAYLQWEPLSAAKTRLIEFPIPIPQGDWVEPASVAIVISDNVKLFPVFTDATSDGMAPLVTSSAPETPSVYSQDLMSHLRRFLTFRVDVPRRQQEPMIYQTTGDAPRFVAGAIYTPRRVSVLSETILRPIQPQEQVVQTIGYTVEFEPIDQVTFWVPAALETPEKSLVTWQVSVAGKSETVPLNVSTVAGDPLVKDGISFIKKSLTVAGIGYVSVTLTYPMGAIEIKQGVSSQHIIPLIVPADKFSMIQRVNVEVPRGVGVTLHGTLRPKWTSHEGGHYTAYQHQRFSFVSDTAEPQEVLPLQFALDDPDALGMTVIQRVWLQTWLKDSVRTDFLSMLVSTNRPSLEVQLPPGVSSDKCHVLVNGRPVSAPLLRDGSLVVPLTDKPTSETTAIDIRCQFSASSGLSTTLALPQFLQNTLIRRVYWNVVLPPQQHLISTPSAWTAEYQWRWNGLFWLRAPLIEMADADFPHDMVRDYRVSTQANQYLFSTFNPSPAATIITMNRSLLVFIASAATLMASLTTIYFPRLRYTGSLITLLVAAVATATVQPTLSLLAMQASVLGVFLVLVSLYCYRLFVTTRPWVAPVVMDVVPSRQTPYSVIVDATDSTPGTPSTTLVLLITAALTLAAPSVRSQETQHADVIQYRNWYVPSETPEAWPLGSDEQYVPILKRDFEAWCQSGEPVIGEHGEHAESLVGVTNTPLRSAVYAARFDGGTSLNGIATLCFAGTPQWRVPFTPLGFWFQADKTRSTESYATSDTVTGAWSLQGSAVRRDVVQFTFAIPESLTSEIILDIPAEWVLSTTDGFLVEPRTTSTREVTDRVMHRIALGTRTKVILILVRRPQRGDVGEQTGMVQTTFWNITPQGVEVTSQLTFGPNEPQLREFFLDIDTPLHLITITHHDNVIQLPATSEESTASLTEGVRNARTRQRVRVPLLESVGTDEIEAIELLVTAHCPLPPEGERNAWTLPCITPVAPSLFVREARGNILVWRPLLTESIDLTHGVPTTPLGVAERPDRDVFAFQFFDTEATIALKLQRQRAVARWDSGTQVVWNGTEVVATMTLDVTAEGGAIHTLELPLQPAWNVDSVQRISSTGSAPESLSWSVRHDDTTPDKSHRLIDVKLVAPLDAGAPPLRLRVEGRRAGLLQTTLGDLVPIVATFPMSGHHVVGVKTSETYRLQWSFIDLPARHLNSLETPAVAQRFAERPEGTLFPLQRLTAALSLTLTPQKPAVSVSIQASVVIRENDMQLVNSFRLTPSGSVIDTVDVRFAADRLVEVASGVGIEESLESIVPSASITTPTQWTWRLGDENELPRVSRVGDTWNVRLPSPRNTPFELIATRQIPLQPGMPIPLPSVVSATEQQAELLIESVELTRFRIDNTRLELLAPPVGPWEEFPSIRAVLRYLPEQELAAMEPSVHLIDATGDGILPAAWVWSQRIHSQFESGGVVRNIATFRIENRGMASTTLTFPPAFTSDDIRALWVDQRRWAWVPESNIAVDRQLRIVVPLPERRRFVIVSVEYALNDLPLTSKRKLVASIPQIDIPVLSSQWFAWIPHDFVVSHKKTRLDDNFLAKDFFLMPSRAGDRTPFDPLSLFSREYWQPHNTEEHDARWATTDFLTQWAAAYQEKRETTRSAVTWGEMLRSLVSGTLGTSADDNSRLSTSTTNNAADIAPARFELFVDRIALASWNVFPTTPTSDPATIPFATIFSDETAPGTATGGVGNFTADTATIRRILDVAGVVLLVSQQTTLGGQRTYRFYLTTSLNVACCRDELEPLFGESVWLITDAAKSTMLTSFVWVTSQRWVTDTTAARMPWEANLGEREFVSVTPTWAAYQSVGMIHPAPLYVVPRDTIVAWGWLLFFGVIAITHAKPLSHPVVLLLIIVIVELAMRHITICYTPLPTGIFLGGIVSLGFSLVRTSLPAARMRLRRTKDHSSSLSVPDASNAKINSTMVPSRHRVEEHHAGSSTHPIFFYIGWWLAWLFITNVAVGAWSEGQSGRPNSLNPEPYRVLIPVDHEQREVGDTVWIAAPFYQELTRRHTHLTPPEMYGVFTEADYHATLGVHPLTRVLSLESLHVRYTVELKRDAAVIRLPIAPSVVQQITWNGAPIEHLRRETQAIEFFVEREGVGQHTIDVAFVPPVEAVGNVRRVLFTIPRIAQSTLTVDFPIEVKPPQISESIGAVSLTSTSSSASQELVAKIGATPTLAMAWVDKASREEQTIIDVDQFFWMWCRAHQTNLRAQFEFRVTSGMVSQLQLQIDPRFRLSGQFRCYHVTERRLLAGETLTGDVAELAATVVEVTPHRSSNETDATTTIQFGKPVGGTILVRADFVLRQFGGIGHVRLPRCSAVIGRIGQSLLMTSADSTLQLSVTGEAERSEIAESEFLNRWNRFRLEPPVSDSPYRAFSLLVPQSRWVMAIEKKPPEVTAILNEVIALDHDTIEVSLDATINVKLEQYTQLIRLPKGMMLDAVEAWLTPEGSSERQIEVRTAVADDDSGLVNIFFRNAISGAYRLSIRGTIAVISEGRSLEPRDLPCIVVANAHITSASISVYRTSKVLVDINASHTTTAPAWVVREVEAQSSLMLAELAGVGRYTYDSVAIPTGLDPSLTSLLPDLLTDPAPTSPLSAAPRAVRSTIPPTPRYTITDNHPQIHAQIIESLKYITATDNLANDRWSVQIDLQLNVTGGEVAILPLIIDDHCAGPLQITPPSVHVVEDIMIDGSRRVVLMATPAIRGDHRLTVTSGLRQRNDRIPIPRVQIERPVVSLEHIVVVPTFVKGEMAWDVSLATPAEVGRYPKLESPQQQVFVVNGSEYSGLGEIVGAGGLVRLLDARFFIRSDGEFFGFTTCDAEGAAGRRLTVVLPPDVPLVELAVGGVIMPITSLERNRVTLPLGTYLMPQRLEIVYRGRLALDSESFARAKNVSDTPNAIGDHICQLPIPRLEGITVHETLWSVAWETDAAQRLSQDTPHLIDGVRLQNTGGSHTLSQRIRPDEAPALLGTLAIIRLERLLAGLDSFPRDTSLEQVNMRRWFGGWERQWNEQMLFLDRLLNDNPDLTMTSSIAAALQGTSALAVGKDKATSPDDATTVTLFLQTVRSLDEARSALQTNFRNHIISLPGSKSLATPATTPAVPPTTTIPTTTPTSLLDVSEADLATSPWISRERIQSWSPMTSIEGWSRRGRGEITLFVGAQRGGLSALSVAIAPPTVHRWWYPSSMVLIWMGLLVFGLWYPLSATLRQAIVATPHYWFSLLGLVFWVLSPPGTLGLVLIIIAIATRYMPLWRGRRLRFTVLTDV